jgi:fatty acid desaturase
LMLMNAGILDYDLSYRTTDKNTQPAARQIMFKLARNLFASVVVHFGMWLVLYLSGHGWLYLLWPLANITSYALISRIRNAAEHAAVPDLLNTDPRLHARTTIPRWWERLLIAPNFVNYHLEHHWAASVPNYRLREFHQYLQHKGLLDDVVIAQGYGDVLRELQGLKTA